MRYFADDSLLFKHDFLMNSDILEGGALDPFVAMAKSENRGNLRLMSVEAIRIISEDVRVGQWTRQKLCDAGAAFACGTILKQDISVLYSNVNYFLFLSFSLLLLVWVGGFFLQLSVLALILDTVDKMG